MEDKRKICDLLLPTLQATDKFKHLEDLEYIVDTDTILVTFADGTIRRARADLLDGVGVINYIIHNFENKEDFRDGK